MRPYRNLNIIFIYLIKWQLGCRLLWALVISVFIGAIQYFTLIAENHSGGKSMSEMTVKNTNPDKQKDTEVDISPAYYIVGTIG